MNPVDCYLNDSEGRIGIRGEFVAGERKNMNLKQINKHDDVIFSSYEILY